MLNRIVLRNFKRHEHLDVAFTEGLNVIFGDNYKGKTTVFYGVLYALGGPTMVPGGTARLDRIDEVGGKFKAEVECYFSVSGRQYYIERSANKCNLFREPKEGEPAGWVRMANSAKNVGDELTTILGFPVRRLASMKYAEQDHMGALLTLGAGELNKIVEEVAEVEVVDRALKGCSGIVKTANAQLEVLNPMPEDVVVEKTQQLAAHQASAMDLLSQVGTYKDELALCEKALTEAKEATHQARVTAEQVVESNKAAEQHNRQRNELKLTLKLREERLSALAGEINPLVPKLAELGDLSHAQSRLASFTSERDEMQNEINQASLAADRRATAEKATQTALTKSGQAVVVLTAANTAALHLLGLEVEGEDTAKDLAGQLLEAIAETVTEMGAAKEVDNETLIEARSKVQRMTQALKDATCPECKRPFEDHDPVALAAELEAAQATVTAKSAAVNTATTMITACAQERRNLEQALAAFVAAEAEVEAAQQTLAHTPQATNEVSVLKEKVALAGQHISACTAKINQINNLTDRIGRLQNEHANVSADVALLAEEVRNGSDMTPEEVPSLAPFMDSQQAAQAQRDLAVTRVQTATQLKDDEVRSSKALEKELHDAELVSLQTSHIGKRKQDTLDLQVYVKGNRDRFMAEMWDGVLAQASQFTSNCTNGDIRAITRIDEEFFFDEGLAETLPVKGSSSGAQRTFMGIGVQLALSMMMNTGFNALMLDEPAAALRDERSIALVAALKASGQQVIIISHSMADAALADNTIEIQ